jgi:hypothetical protein
VDVVVNMIYTPGTVAALSRFIPLLVGNTPWRYRLVANHCGVAEENLLAWHAARSDRLAVHRLTTAEVLPLGKALCALYDQLPAEPIFAFMDSDIVVTGDLAAEFEPLLDQHEAVFSGTPIWAIPADQVLADDQTEVAGPHTHTPAGIALGSSYFGLYRRDTLDRVIRDCLVTLDKYTDISGCAAPFHRFLADHRLVRRDYVPPKLLNLAYTHLGLPIAYRESMNMHHIGGYSMATYQQATADLAQGNRPANAGEILDYADHRPHMTRKTAVCDRLITSFAQIDQTGHAQPPGTLPQPLEDRVRLIERIYTIQARTQTGRPPL